MISCIMANYNTDAQYLIESIESILKQTYKDFELIIVDDCSTDGSLAILENYASKDNRVQILKNNMNLGLAASLNRALKMASGEYIARMDTDDISEPNRFEYQLKYLLEKDLDLVGTELRRINERGEIIVPYTNKSYCYMYIQKTIRYDDCVAHPSWFAKKTVYDNLDGYRLLYACEDYDFLLRAVKQGFRIGICDSILLNYRINTKGISQKNLLLQFSSARYLASNYRRIENVSQEEIDKKVALKISEKSKNRFGKALSEYDKVRDCFRHHRISMIKHFFLSIFYSKYILGLYNCAIHIGFYRLYFSKKNQHNYNKTGTKI